MISVIIPVHNGIETLDRAVRSVCAQTVLAREQVEILLVDDGSTEKTAKHCDELAGNGGMVGIRVFHMEDRGVSAARNLGLDHAEGDYITFLDDDDAMEPSMLLRLLQVQIETGADICGCGFRSVIPSEGVDSVSPSTGAAKETGRGHLSEGDPAENRKAELFRGDGIIIRRILQRDTRVWSKLFTRDAIGSSRFLEGLTIGEDMLFVTSLVRDNTIYAALEDPLYCYTVNPKGAMERPFTRSYMDQIRCWDEAWKVLCGHFPAVADNHDAVAQLGALRIVSDVLTASKIAKLPEQDWREYQPEFERCRACLQGHRGIPGAKKRIPKDYRVKAVLLEKFPGLYRVLYRPRRPAAGVQNE